MDALQVLARPLGGGDPIASNFPNLFFVTLDPNITLTNKEDNYLVNLATHILHSYQIPNLHTAHPFATTACSETAHTRAGSHQWGLLGCNNLKDYILFVYARAKRGKILEMIYKVQCESTS